MIARLLIARLLIPRLLCAASLAACAITAASITAARAKPVTDVLSPFGLCEAAITAASRLPGHVPSDILPNIARVESGRIDPASGRVRPWPWTINVDGVGYYFETKADVVEVVQKLQAAGKSSIDVGCMQVNLMHHPNAFLDLDEAFDPLPNAVYAETFLVSLYQQTKDWSLATARYHSATPELGEEYQRLVFGRVITPMGGGGVDVPASALQAFTALTARFNAIPAADTKFGAFAPAAGPSTAVSVFGSGPTIGAFPNLFQPSALTGRKR